ncbi:MAG: agmatinase [candidate division WOR-3 bacterium]
MTLGKIEYANASFKNAQIVIMGIPYDRTSSFIPGSRLGPRYIRICTENIEWFSPYQNRSLDSNRICDLGDYEFTTEDYQKEIEREVFKIYQKKKTAVFLGGEHTITFPVIKGIKSLVKKFSIIHFDAHADLRDELHGERVCHATAIRRVADIIDLKHIYQFGIRSGTEEEFKLNKNLYPFEVYRPLKKILDQIPEPFYLTIDVDVLDPSQCPAVATPEPGGISFRELIEALLLFRVKKIIGADIVEFNPLATSPWASGSTVADILRELILVMCSK